MKRTLLYALILLVTSLLPSLASAQTAAGQGAAPTLKSGMEALHQIYGVNFVYDSSIALDIPGKGKPMKTILPSKPALMPSFQAAASIMKS